MTGVGPNTEKPFLSYQELVYELISDPKQKELIPNPAAAGEDPQNPNAASVMIAGTVPLVPLPNHEELKDSATRRKYGVADFWKRQASIQDEIAAQADESRRYEGLGAGVVLNEAHKRQMKIHPELVYPWNVRFRDTMDREDRV